MISTSRRTLMQGGAGALGAAALGLQLSTAQAQDPQSGGTIVVARTGDFLNFDPFYNVAVNLPMYRQLFDTLVVYDGELNILPHLAESWEYSEDRLTLTFKLRSGVLFHNGREFVADDVVQNIDRAKDDTIGHSVLGYTRLIESVEAIDPTTVVFTFSGPHPTIWDLLTVLGIVAPESSSVDDLLSNPVGTGPFSFVEWVPGQQATFAKFEDYWQDNLPYLDEVVVRAPADPQAALAGLRAGEINILQGVPFNEVPQLREDDSLQIVLGTEAAQFYTFYMNTARPPFDNKLVRQAISHAIDRQTIVDAVLFGVGKVSQTPFPESSIAYSPDHVNWFPYDLDRARELLAEAGYADGFETTTITISAFPELSNMAQIVQADLGKIGITTEIQDLSSADWGQVWPAKEYDTMISFAGFSHKDPATLFSSQSAWWLDSNRTNFNPPEYNDQGIAAETIIDPDERAAAYIAFAEYMLDEAFALSISFRYNVFAMTSDVRDFKVHLNDDMELGTTWRES